MKWTGGFSRGKVVFPTGAFRFGLRLIFCQVTRECAQWVIGMDLYHLFLGTPQNGVPFSFPLKHSQNGYHRKRQPHLETHKITSRKCRVKSETLPNSHEKEEHIERVWKGGGFGDGCKPTGVDMAPACLPPAGNWRSKGFCLSIVQNIMRAILQIALTDLRQFLYI